MSRFCLSSTTLMAMLVLLTACSPVAETPKEPVAAIPKGESSTHIKLTSDQITKFGLTVEPVKIHDLAENLEVAATVQPDENLTMPVSSLVPGRVEEVHVTLGDHVKKGDVLVTIRSEDIGEIEADFLQSLLDQRAELKQRLLELSVERKQLVTRVDYLHKQHERRKVLVENKIGSRAELEQAESEHLQAQAELEAQEAKENSTREAYAAKEHALYITAKEKLKLHGLREEEIDRVASEQTVKSMFQIRAPKSGVIASRQVDPGEATDANQHLFVIMDLSRVWMVGQIFEKDVGRLSMHMPVTCTVDSYPGKLFKGHLDYIGTKMDPNTRTLPIRASVKNDAMNLRPDMFGEVILDVGNVKALSISHRAIQKIGETQIVYVEESPGVYNERKVTLGPAVGDQVRVLSGLVPGERVVAEGSIHLVGTTLERLSEGG